jgi:molybdenum cofactor cytidylyltransferase
VVRDRLVALGSRLGQSHVVAHDVDRLSESLSGLGAAPVAPILIFGASAIVDRGDVIPAAITRVGGEVLHFGMPVDPGNLLLLARIGEKAIIGLPSCARSPKPNGFDMILQRILAGLPVDRDQIIALGSGGLLKEITTRPHPRATQSPADREPETGERLRPPRAPKIAALILAAGQGRRMGTNKMLAPVAGKPLLAHTMEAIRRCAVLPPIVVTGDHGAEVAAIVGQQGGMTIHNPDYENGLASSLRRGLAALPADAEGVLICLGDMPLVGADHIDRLIAAFNPAEGRAICVPVRKGRRGNPVLWSVDFCAEMQELDGDQGARSMLALYAEKVVDVDMPDDAIFIDVDTPSALEALRRQIEGAPRLREDGPNGP